MKKGQLSLSGLLMTMAILTVVELAVIGFFDNRPLYAGLVLMVNAFITGLAIFQQRSYALRRGDLIRSINHASDDSLNTALSALPMGLIRFAPGTREPEWCNQYIDLIFDETPDKEKVEELLQLAYNHRPLEAGARKYTVDFDSAHNIIYLVDDTAELEAKATLTNRRPVIGVITVDNYSDAADALTEGQRSTLNSFIANYLDNFAIENKIYLRRLNSDRYIFFTNYDILSVLMTDKFSFLNDFREQSTENKSVLTLSIGISYGTRDFAAIGKTALNNLDLALVRGGDQVVIKENMPQARAVYFGGNSESRVVKSRTRARAIATALRTIISESDKVFIVGHQYMDMDALGAAIAMKNFVAMNAKEAFVVYREDQLLRDVGKAINALNDDNEELYKHIIQLDTAKKSKGSNDLLIMVDHSKTSQTLDLDFYKSFTKVVVIDHHRRDEDFPEHAMLSYIESGASSASEMTVEILQFQDSAQQKMTAVEASVALAGISVDTKSFKKATTEKTFEAASYLRAQGANNETIQYFLATDFADFKKINGIVLAAELLRPSVAVALGNENESYENVTLAKAADELLTMDGIAASFTLAKNAAGDILISARSRGKINVQTIMEAMNGGGHFDSAATKLSHTTLPTAKERLLESLDENL